jgi:hypothetical protein
LHCLIQKLPDDLEIIKGKMLGGPNHSTSGRLDDRLGRIWEWGFAEQKAQELNKLACL